MDDKVNYTLVGAFVLVLGAVFVAAVLWLAAGLGGQRAVDTYQAVIRESVAGLNVDAPVKNLGVAVGKVIAQLCAPLLTVIVPTGLPLPGPFTVRVAV